MAGVGVVEGTVVGACNHIFSEELKTTITVCAVVSAAVMRVTKSTGRRNSFTMSVIFRNR